MGLGLPVALQTLSTSAETETKTRAPRHDDSVRLLFTECCNAPKSIKIIRYPRKPRCRPNHSRHFQKHPQP